MPTPNIETARGWLGRVVVDRDSNKIGEVVDIYMDNETGRPEWAVVRTGLFGMRSTFVPLAEAREVGDELQVPHPRLEVKEAPNIEPDGQLSEVEEAELYRHYGLDYDTVTLDSGSPAGQTLADPAGQTPKPETNDQAGAAMTGVPEPASTAPGGLADTGMDAEHGTPASVTGSSGLDREPDTSSIESEQGRRGAGDELSAAGAGEPVEPARQDQLHVGEGMNRPFVYETPGRAEGGADTRRRQPGQVRLRRYLVTEVVTDTEAGQRHEVRVQSEPVSDAEVDAVLTPPDRQDEPIGQGPNGPRHNDWFSDEATHGTDPAS
ncbi:MAG TPA: PRC-barrel domain-containing protein [Actinomycetota bacterium]|nr:PRC-barrel domain-containing protein [Actinomycetota bacterium]